MRKRAHKPFGFTLIELMLVVALLGVLTSIGIPQMANLVRKAKEATTLANLGALRSALQIYYSENLQFPGDQDDDLRSLTNGKRYLDKLPVAYYFPYHPPTNSVHTCDNPPDAANDGYTGWVYGAYDEQFGHIYPSCWHTTLSGRLWYDH